MKKTMMLLTAGVLLLASCNSKQPEATSTETATEMTTETKPLDIKLASLADNKDHVCGMDLEEGSVSDTAHHDGKVYGFCAAECKAEFVKNPAQYLAN